MTTAVDSLFALLRTRLRRKDILEFVPADPGYEDYVRVWTPILETGELPDQPTFDHSEIIGLTQWASPADVEHPDRFLLFRMFTSCVAMRFYISSREPEPLNYTVLRLINDAHDLKDAAIQSLVGELLAEVGQTFRDQGNRDPALPFLTAAEMIFAHRNGDFERADRLAKRLLTEEQAVRSSESASSWLWSNRFLLGLTPFDQLNDEWERTVAGLDVSKNGEELKLVVKAMTGQI